MSHNFEEYIAVLEQQLPEICATKHLEQIEIFGSNPAICRRRQNGTGPSFFTVGPKKIRYMKKDIVQWLRDSYQNNNNMKKEKE